MSDEDARSLGEPGLLMEEVERLRAVEVELRRAQIALQRSEAIHRALHDITSDPSLDFDDQVVAILELGCTEFGLPIGILSRVEGDRYEVVHAVSPGDSLRSGQVFPLGKTYCARTVRMRRAVHFEHAGESEWRTHPAYAEFRLEAYAGARVMVGDRVFGTLNFSSPSPRRVNFSRADDEILIVMADWIGGEIRRAESERRLAESERRFHGIFDLTFQFTWLMLVDGTVIEANRSALAFAGVDRDDVVDHHFWETRPWSATPETRARVRDAVARAAAGEFVRYEETARGDGDRIATLDLSLKPIRDEAGQVALVITEARDVTQIRITEEQLRQGQKMEAVGRLAGGIAHDFNNLLFVIIANSESALETMDDDDPARADVVEILDAGQRASALTRQLLALGRKQDLAPRVLNLNRRIEAAETMLRSLLGERIVLSTRLDPNLGNTRVDPVQVEQILVNLVINARDALPDGGRVEIETANVESDDVQSGRSTPDRSGAYVRLTVRDDGDGMDADTRDRVFEPFFSTKEAGEGIGMGLATVYGIVSQSGGNISVDSEPGSGTGFVVLLPRVADHERPEPGESVAAAAPSLEGSETILLVEDSEMVRPLVARALRSHGYRVLEAPSGEHAVTVAGKHDGVIHAVVTDLVMPGMDGGELVRRLAATRSGIRSVVMSGYASDTVCPETVLDERFVFLQKPFPANDLLRALRRLLDDPD